MLYICATPIGNLDDISLRALNILKQSDIILCEDTRVSYNLFNYHNIIPKKLVAFHQHNEEKIIPQIIKWLIADLTITQITDAGTPNISDPGNRLYKEVIKQNLPISPLPGACAYISLLSVSGVNLPCLFYGFLPNRSTKRSTILAQWIDVDFAVCIYEAPHRIIECIKDIINILGNDRIITFGRELTKKFETIKQNTACEILAFIEQDTNQQRGEFVLIIHPPQRLKEHKPSISNSDIDVLTILLQYMGAKQAVNIVHTMNGSDKKLLYQQALLINESE
jgi:16S rRNA (cytidine1402-2'-O)-methyltransferase